jgi:PAS domain S-box-containing protein
LSLIRDVTEQRRRQREFEQIFNAVDDPITIHDPETAEHIRVNDGFCELLGYSREEIAGMSIGEYSVAEKGYTTERAREFVRSVVEGDGPKETEWVVETADGERRWLRVRGTLAEIGGQQRFVSIDRDITERVRREREYEQIFNGVNDVITIHDPDTGEYIEVNDTLCELTGYSREEILEMGIEGLSVTEEGYTAERAKAFVERVVETGEPDTVEWKVETADGEHRWLEVNGSLATIGGEQRFISLDRDITEQVRREREYEQIFHGVTDVVAVHDPGSGAMVDVNDTMCELTGYSREAILDRGAEGLLVDHPDADYPPGAVPEIVDRVMGGEAVGPYEQPVETADGDVVWLEVNPTRAVIGGEERFLAISRDITERRRRRREFEQIFHGVTDIITVYDPDSGELLDVNETMCELLGYDRERILELGPDGVSATELGYDRDTVEQVVREVAATGEPARGIEWALRTASGETLWAEVNATPTELNGRQRVLAIARDVTERRDREERVQVLNRVLRHNLRNDMDAVQGYAAAIERTAERERAREHARRIRETAEELLRLGSKARSTEAVLRDDERRQTEPVENGLRAAVAEARERVDGDLSVRTTGGAGEVPVEAGVFRLVVKELVENAAEHGTGPVGVRAAFGSSERGERGEEERRLTVEVADDGPGIPDRVLTPFRTGGETQFEHNHGLGLWLVNWGVRRLGGSIEFDRPEDGGTVARLRLPVVDG